MKCWYDANMTCLPDCELIEDCPARARLLEERKATIDELMAECERFKNQYKTFYFQDLVNISKIIKEGNNNDDYR